MRRIYSPRVLHIRVNSPLFFKWAWKHYFLKSLEGFFFVNDFISSKMGNQNFLSVSNVDLAKKMWHPWGKGKKKVVHACTWQAMLCSLWRVDRTTLDNIWEDQEELTADELQSKIRNSTMALPLLPPSLPPSVFKLNSRMTDTDRAVQFNKMNVSGFLNRGFWKTMKYYEGLYGEVSEKKKYTASGHQQ